MEISERVKQFIKDCTRSCSNLEVSLDSDIVCSYAPWLTPDQALRAVEIAREELANKAYEWLGEHLMTDYWSQRIASTDHFIEKFKQAMEE